MYGKTNRVLWLVIIMLIGALAAVVGGILLDVAGANLPASLGGSGAAFGGLVTIGLKIMQILSE